MWSLEILDLTSLISECPKFIEGIDDNSEDHVHRYDVDQHEKGHIIQLFPHSPIRILILLPNVHHDVPDPISLPQTIIEM